jgi:hypothetical protein
LADFFKVENSRSSRADSSQANGSEPGNSKKTAVNWHCSDVAYSEALDGGISIETPFGDTTAVVVLVTDMPHHIFGHGLYVVLKFPYLDKPEAIHAPSIKMSHRRSDLVETRDATRRQLVR